MIRTISCLALDRNNGFQAVPDFSFCHIQFIGFLQVYPQVGPGAEELAEPEGRISGNIPLAVYDLINPVIRYSDADGQLHSVYADLIEFTGQNFAGVDRVFPILAHSLACGQCLKCRRTI